ncbi:MAG: M48 family peptidase [Chloroflexi bacterium]|nr:MAG: M48 family peptidase [Chloroflexota bacterium]
MNGTVSRLSQRGFFIRYEQRIFYFAGYNLIMPDESAAVQIDTFIRAKRRTIALIVERDGSLTVRAPKRATLRDIHNFIEEKKDWILRSREKLKAIDEIPKKNFADGERFPFLGQDYELRLVPPQRPALKFGSGFTLAASARLRGEQAFIKWYKSQALTIFTERVNHFSALHGFFPRRVRVNSAKTRWGSCAADGTINFTWRLVMAPPEVIDYVVLHELAHLKIKNHSPRFWKLVESLCPDFKRLRKWLRENGEKLNL